MTAEHKEEPNEEVNLCSSHPDICCPCCTEFQVQLNEEKRLYMDNEKEWQLTIAEAEKRGQAYREVIGRLVDEIKTIHEEYIDTHSVGSPPFMGCDACDLIAKGASQGEEK